MKKRVCIYLNPYYTKPTCIIDVLRELTDTAPIELYGLKEQKDLLPDFVTTITEKDAKKVQLDWIFVFGGDGTILRSVNFSIATDTPILGINLGRLGFLSDVSLSELKKSVIRLMEGKYTIQERMLLRAMVRRDGACIHRGTALNDVIVHKGKIPTLIDVRLKVNRRFVLEARCDGMIAASPTGSTAYSLSAGGPILSPVMEAIVVAPLNPHVLSVRPMLFEANDSVTFQLSRTHGESMLQLDGQNVLVLHNNDEIMISRAAKKVRFVKLSNKTFYQILRKKMHMGRI